MFTIFDLLRILGAAMGLLLGWSCGHHLLGIPGAIAGACLGLLGGATVGQMPYVWSCRSLFRELERCSSTQLQEQLGTRWFITHFIIAQLLKRGEPVGQFRDHVIRLLRSEYSDRRNIGWTCTRLYFPELERELAGFRPFASVSACRALTDRLSPVPDPPTVSGGSSTS